jgi:hypothetical protein
MPAPLSGPGLGLQLPQYLYPSELTGAPPDVSNNRICLAAGDAIPIPAGDWYISTGMYSVIQYLDPVTGVWAMGPSSGWLGSPVFVKSDGFNLRIANLLACPVSAAVTAPGNGSYVQASTTIAVVGGGGSTWKPIVGGQLATLSITSYGAGYGVAPLVFIPAPPPPSNNANGVGGIQAAAYAVIANGTVSGITFTNPGAGYQSAPTATILPNPTDPNIATGITAAAVTFSVIAAGSITGALCTNNGAPLATPANITLTVSGAGANATLTANVLQTVKTASVTAGGTGYGTTAALLTTVGGAPSQGSFTNSPEYLYLSFRPRPAQIGLTPSGANGSLATQLGTIYDGGLFMGTPTPIVSTYSFATSAATIVGATISLTMGSVPDFVSMQPAP